MKHKGSIAVGKDADIEIWDPSMRKTIRHGELHDGSDYSPYEGLEVSGWPTTVVVGGTVMISEGQLCGPRGAGKYIVRMV
ncbi:amidohydrolase family protein [Mesorhizobium sp. M1348]|uniref:amidohydrolase family protein n=1 Tax=Mesorhizobium sp. M1348 TaxID=2957089 RepID=UPI00333B675E